MDHIAEVAAGIAYIPAGIIYGYLLLLPTATDKLTACLYEETYYWPHIIAIVAMLITVVLTNGLKLNYRKTQFIHLYLQLAATAFALTAGLVFLLVEGKDGDGWGALEGKEGGGELVGLLAFYWVLLVSGIAASRTVLEREDVGYLPFWLLVGGALLTTLLSLRLAPKTTFVGASVLTASRCCCFFAFLGAALPLPAINILELAPLNCNEAALALGTALELLAVALLQYYGVTMGDTLFGIEQPAGGGDPVPASDHKGVIAAHYITAIVLGVVAAVATLWHVPNTGRKSLAEIESDLARMRSYFAFSRRHLASPTPAAPAPAAATLDETMVPPPPRDAVAAPHHATNGRLADDALEELPVPHEQQLSARNAARFAALYPDSPDPRNGSYGSPASHSPNGRSRSPYNDFDRHYSPHHHQDAVQLQDALRRQHEANYLNARLLLQQQRAVSSSPTNSGRALTPETIQPLPLLPVPLAGRAGPGQRPEPPLGSLTVKSEPGTMLRPALLTQKSDAPAPPPMPPADYLTKSLPRVKAVRQSRIPPIVPKPEPPAEVVVPGVEYSHNLVPSQFLRQSLQNSQLFR
uniref:Uncharacterized protein n=1 Tax=Anopheles coluzzii TaxID=1518534 RepID=A0A8W7NZY7_ANOCL